MTMHTNPPDLHRGRGPHSINNIVMINLVIESLRLDHDTSLIVSSTTTTTRTSVLVCRKKYDSETDGRLPPQVRSDSTKFRRGTRYRRPAGERPRKEVRHPRSSFGKSRPSGSPATWGAHDANDHAILRCSVVTKKRPGFQGPERRADGHCRRRPGTNEQRGAHSSSTHDRCKRPAQGESPSCSTTAVDRRAGPIPAVIHCAAGLILGLSTSSAPSEGAGRTGRRGKRAERVPVESN